MEDVDCDLAGEEEATELGSFDGIREALAGDEGAEMVTTGASTWDGSSLTNVPWRSGGDGGVSFFGELVLDGVFGAAFGLLLNPGLASPDLVVRLDLFVRTWVFVTMLFAGEVRGVSSLEMARFGGDGVVFVPFVFLAGGEVLVVFR